MGSNKDKNDFIKVWANTITATADVRNPEQHIQAKMCVALPSMMFQAYKSKELNKKEDVQLRMDLLRQKKYKDLLKITKDITAENEKCKTKNKPKANKTNDTYVKAQKAMKSGNIK